MAGFVPKEKLSKKAQKELNRQRRKTWDFSPVTRTVDSKKLYNRRKSARNRYDEYGTGVSHFQKLFPYINCISGNSVFLSGSQIRPLS